MPVGKFDRKIKKFLLNETQNGLDRKGIVNGWQKDGKRRTELASCLLLSFCYPVAQVNCPFAIQSPCYLFWISTQVNRLTTSPNAPIGALKCNFSPFHKIITDRHTCQEMDIRDHRPFSLPLSSLIVQLCAAIPQHQLVLRLRLPVRRQEGQAGQVRGRRCHLQTRREDVPEEGYPAIY